VKLELLGTHDLMLTPPPPMLVEHLVYRYGVTGVSSDPGVGKTFFALDLARCVVTGERFLGTFDVRPGAVLFVGQDASLVEYARQHRKVSGAHYMGLVRDAARDEDTGDSDPLAQDRLEDFEDRFRFLIQPGLRLEQVDNVLALEAAANSVKHSWSEIDPDTGDLEHHTGVSLIVLDTLASLHGLEENSNTQMQVLFQHLRALAENTHAAVVVLHHHPYANEFNQGDRWRGASSMFGALDGHIVLKPQPATDLIQVVLKKFRGIKIEPFSYQMHMTEERVQLEYKGQRGETDPFLNDVIAFVAGCGELFKNKHVVENLHKTYPLIDQKTLEARVSDVLSTLNRRGLVEKKGRGLWLRPPLTEEGGGD